MAASSELTWDIAIADGGARRPTLDDVGGAALIDDVSDPPARDGRMPYADMLNECQRQAVATARVVPSARLTIAFSGGAPYVAGLMTASATLVAEDFTLTDDGNGNTRIAWTAGILPAMVCDPTGSTNSSAGDVTSFNATRVSASSIRVMTTSAGVAADVRFTVEIH